MKQIKLCFICLLILSCIFFDLQPYSAETYTSAEKLIKLGILEGPGSGITSAYLAHPATRIDSAILMLKLKGLIDAAEGYEGPDNFSDTGSALSEYSRRIMSYLRVNPHLGFVGYANNFYPNTLITDQMMYKVLLTLLGYNQGTDFEWSETIVMARLAGMDEIAGMKTLTIGDAAAAIVEALNTEIKDTGVLLIEQLVRDGVLSLQSVHEAGWDYINTD